MRSACAAFVAVGAMLAFATSAKATGFGNYSYSLTLTSADAISQPTTPATFHLSGTIKWRVDSIGPYLPWGFYPWGPYKGGPVTVTEYQGTTVVDTMSAHINPMTGTFALDPVTITKTGTYTFVAETKQWKRPFHLDTVVVSSDPLPVTVGTPAPEPTPVPPPAGENSFFLCYSVFQFNPGVWPYHIAAELMAGGGYWQPYAVKGNVPYGTNIGDYHLVCNLAAGQAAGQQFAGAGGDVSGPEAYAALTGQLGWYPVVP